MKQHGLVRLDQLLPGVGFPKPPPPKENRPPIPRPPKVIGDPTREPVNKQAALLLQKATWLTRPLPPEPAPVSELARLKAEAETLRNTNTQLAAENAALRRRVARLEATAEALARRPGAVRPVAMAMAQVAADHPKRKLLERLTNGT